MRPPDTTDADAIGAVVTKIGAIFLCARAWDALIDPAIGILSDRTRTRWGRRWPKQALS